MWGHDLLLDYTVYYDPLAVFYHRKQPSPPTQTYLCYSRLSIAAIPPRMFIAGNSEINLDEDRRCHATRNRLSKRAL